MADADQAAKAPNSGDRDWAPVSVVLPIAAWRVIDALLGQAAKSNPVAADARAQMYAQAGPQMIGIYRATPDAIAQLKAVMTFAPPSASGWSAVAPLDEKLGAEVLGGRAH